jgi:hypothetical protein
MNMYKWADQIFLCGNYKSFLFSDPGVLPAGVQFPNVREVTIQISKWERMLDRHALVRDIPSKTAKRLKLAVMTKEELKNEGRLSAQTMEQGRKVARLVRESLWRLFREHDAKSGCKPRSKREFAEFWKRWEALMWEHRRNFFKKMSKELPPIQNAELQQLGLSRQKQRARS